MLATLLPTLAAPPLLLAVGAAVVVGVVSAVLPLVNAEAYLVAVAPLSPGAALFAAAAGLAVGQTAGKVALFAAARGGRRLRGQHEPGTHRRTVVRSRAAQEVRTRLQATGGYLSRLMDRGPWCGPVILLSASVGVPPLAATSILAGLRSMPAWLFTLSCLVGRLARFFAIAWPAGQLL